MKETEYSLYETIEDLTRNIKVAKGRVIRSFIIPKRTQVIALRDNPGPHNNFPCLLSSSHPQSFSHEDYEHTQLLDKNKLRFLKKVNEEWLAKSPFVHLQRFACQQKIRRLLRDGPVEYETNGTQFRFRHSVLPGQAHLDINHCDYYSIRNLEQEECLTSSDPHLRSFTKDPIEFYLSSLEEVWNRHNDTLQSGFDRLRTGLARIKHMEMKGLSFLSALKNSEHHNKLSKIIKEESEALKIEEEFMKLRTLLREQLKERVLAKVRKMLEESELSAKDGEEE